MGSITHVRDPYVGVNSPLLSRGLTAYGAAARGANRELGWALRKLTLPQLAMLTFQEL